MNTKDLNELKEMTGLVSENELSVAPQKQEQATIADESMVGEFVEAIYNGKAHYGMITDVCDLFGKAKYGVVSATENERVEFLASPTDTKVAEGAARMEAIRSANKYFNDEIESLKFHLNFLTTAEMASEMKCDYYKSAVKKLLTCIKWRDILRK